jgi:hypothetical protein
VSRTLNASRHPIEEEATKEHDLIKAATREETAEVNIIYPLLLKL